jgi:hypothetical protein
MKREGVWLGRCCLVFCDNYAHYSCDECWDDFCKEHMENDFLCKECGA